MKIAIGHKLQSGPYGGGNAFVRNLAAALTAAGHAVSFDLEVPGIDIVVMTDPRPRSPNVAFAAGAILRYLDRNPDTLVIHRINECDERKGTKSMNLRLRLANYCADHTVLVGSWLKGLNLVHRHAGRSENVILNGADEALYYPGGVTWDGSGPLKLVTHHWGGNWMKGFDVYAKLDALLAEPEWAKRIAFTYIGNLPEGFAFKRATYLKPLSGSALADGLRAHHVYVTGSINEPGGNHQIEGGLCGLPLLYRNSGCMPEYCEGFGIGFDGDDVVPALERMLAEYPRHRAAMEAFPHTASRTTAAWMALIEDLDGRRSELLAARRAKRSRALYWINQIRW